MRKSLGFVAAFALAVSLLGMAPVEAGGNPAGPGVCSKVEPLTAPLEGIKPQDSSADPCIDDCNQSFGWCLDGCQSWPYPGCDLDCRASRNACYQECGFP